MATDKELVENFVMEFADMMSGFIEDYESYSDSLARLETNVKALHKDISSVTKIVRDGNGQPPLMTRMAILEEKAKRESGWRCLPEHRSVHVDSQDNVGGKEHQGKKVGRAIHRILPVTFLYFCVF